ncbi:hypothetical protein BDV23DRAFT_157727 [Aspergillus alliaceus]|uniref:Uncharacterized protein n=1 Tax=Petromyces alliaceus TaxID=209559 RepID=A0A5N7C547_PETAA|nr:hypothetical protein BDV23DRAFT_157727 [Aspergillus alliaceus]
MSHPKSADDKKEFASQGNYIVIVRQKGRERGLTEGYNPSSALQDTEWQYLALIVFCM